MNTTDHQAAGTRALARIIGRTMRSAGARALVSEVAKDLIGSWAGTGGVRKRLAAPALWAATRLGSSAPARHDGGTAADMGTLFTAWARTVNASEQAAAPAGGAAMHGEATHDFLRSTDFGEIREMAERSKGRVIEALEAFNEHLWSYPAKAGSILGTLLALVNTGISSVRTLLQPIEKKVGPDLMADLLLSLVRRLDAGEIARLVNSASELIRRVHTGNLLLARAGRPLLQVYLTALLEEGLPLIDPALLKKARVALAEDREAAAHALVDALKEHPDLVLEMVRAHGSLKSPAIRAFSRRTRMFEELDREALAGAVAQGLADLDTYEIANSLNTLVRVLNGIHEFRPEVLSSFITSVADSLDTEEIRAAAAWIVPEVVEALRPILDAAVPSRTGAPLCAGGAS
jgi:hypothetical protein